VETSNSSSRADFEIGQQWRGKRSLLVAMGLAN